MRGPHTILANVSLANLLLALIVAPTAASEGATQSRLYQTLTGRNEQAKLRALSSLDQDPEQRTEALDELVAAVNTIAAESAESKVEGLAESTVHLIQLIGSIDAPSATETLISLLDAQRMEIAMVSAEVLGQINCRAALPALKQQARRSEFATQYGFRFGLFRAIAQIEDPEAVEFLAASLPKLSGQLAHEVDKFLSQVTVDHFRGDQARFDEWKRRHEQRLDPATELAESDYLRPQYAQPHYYGIGIHAEKVVFVIDCSGSMSEVVYSESRLRQAKRELIRAIRSLPETTRFTIVLYETGVREWRKNLVEASDRNKKAAIRFVERVRCGGWTNTYGGLTRAIELDDDVEAIYLLSDGAPTRGKIVEPGEILEAIGRHNAFRHITINAVAISPEGVTQRFMRELADRNGGEYQRTD